MTNSQETTDGLFKSVSKFADKIRDNFRQSIDAQPEDQLKSPVGELMREIGEVAGLEVGWRSEVHADDLVGRPDLGVTVSRLLTGHIELKRPGMGANPDRFTGSNRAQWKRFQALPNLIYTDGQEWSLYRNGELVSNVRISDNLVDGGAESLDTSALTGLDRLCRNFLHWEPVVPHTSEHLAAFLAPLARLLREEVHTVLERENTALNRLAEEWRDLLFPDADDAQFADAYAQTLTYALLLARFEGAESLNRAIAVDILSRQHGLLAQALNLLEVDSVREELRMPIELLERSISAVDSKLISTEGDPWLYFYEHFLSAYDPRLRRERGVYYTPIEVVHAQVRFVDELLRTRFHKPLSFADDEVTVLDPAVGTGTYPLAVLEHTAQVVSSRLGRGAVPSEIHKLAQNLYAFEILVGPYSVAHLRVSQKLRDLGVDGGPINVYLADTLDSPNTVPEFKASLLQEHLTTEHKRAQEIKTNNRVFVCLGNPPYNREQRDPEDLERKRKGGWVRYGDEGSDSRPILEDFLEPVRKSGGGLHLKNLYNDYVYFWRWAMWKVFDSSGDGGIVTFITASSYLRGPGFAGMRRKMREVFDELWVIDLEGDNRGARKTENVFAIRTPVAIAIGVRRSSPNPDSPAKVWKIRLTGSEKMKLSALDVAESIDDLDWSLCSDNWDAPFHPIGTGAYFDWPTVTEVFPHQFSGVKLSRTWPIGETRDLLIARWRNLCRSSPNQRSVLFKETQDRRIDARYPSLRENDERDSPIESLTRNSPHPPISAYGYRALDRQWVISDSRIGDRMRPELWRSHGARQVYMTGLLTNVLGAGPAVMATGAIPDLDHFRGSFGAKNVIPLWRDADASNPNVTRGLLGRLSTEYRISVSAEKLFAYAYGVLAQPSYVKRFWDELEMPPPHLPITKDAELFTKVADHGARLIYLHTYGERFGSSKDDGSVPQGNARCITPVSLDRYPADHHYEPSTQILQVGDGEFAPVAKDVYEYSVSGLQVVKSWLDYRKLNRAGRKSSPLDDIRPARWAFTNELLELLWVLEHTISMQPYGAALLDEVCSSDLFTADELPTPTDAERRAPSQTQMISSGGGGGGRVAFTMPFLNL